MKTTLTIEESARLIKLGVDANKASEIEYRPKKCGYGRNKYLVYSLADLLSILPKEITSNETIMGDDFTSELQIDWDCNQKLWICGYLVLPHPLDVGIAPELIDALYQLLIWCLEQGYLKTEKK